MLRNIIINSIDTAKFAALTYSTLDENAIITTIVNWICAVILAIGIIYGGWELAQGFMDENGSKKKQGVTAMLVGVSVAGVIYGIMQLILSSGGNG